MPRTTNRTRRKVIEVTFAGVMPNEQPERVRDMDDEQVEAAIELLKRDPAVKLAKKEENIRNRRRQYLHSLRRLKTRGDALMKMGITPQNIEGALFPDERQEAYDWFDDECEGDDC